MRGELSLGQLVASEIVIALAAQSLTKTPKLMEKVYDLVAAHSKLESAAAPLERATPPARRSLPLLARLTTAGVILAALLLALVPWRQTAFSRGRVIAYAPTDRQQTVEAPIEGRVVRWHVQEGQRVRQGDPLVDISDNDPAILVRLTAEREALHARLGATQRRASAMEVRVASLGESRMNAQSAARARVGMAKERLTAALRARDAAVAGVTAARKNVERQRKLASEGLAAERTVELSVLDDARAHAELDRAEATVRAAQEELSALEAEQRRALTDADAQIGDARAVLAAAEAEMAAAGAEIARMDVRLARQASQAVVSPRDGVILRVVANAQGGAMVKSGDTLLVMIPDTADRAAELFVTGLDAPLVQVGQLVRVQFEGWPAVQFSGWPQVAIGTFEAKVALVDAASDDRGRLRVVVVESQSGTWPDSRFLRQNVRVQGWVLLGNVSLGFELWRRLNGFPPSLPEAPEETASAKGMAES
ncbi:MAG: HlyD family efflux transporter periplasmic adaptor subunit [Deltaproteobacteria bacterium]|nr:HlyD family efflux transporter periplasmic adaptor subunit [Deltaproteobacteria bacterium]